MKNQSILLAIALSLAANSVSFADQAGIFGGVEAAAAGAANDQDQRNQNAVSQSVQSAGRRQEAEYRRQEAVYAAELTEKRRQQESENQTQRNDQYKQLLQADQYRRQLLEGYHAGRYSKNEARSMMLLLDGAMELAESQPSTPNRAGGQSAASKKSTSAKMEAILLDGGCAIKMISKDKNVVYRGGKIIEWRDLGGAILDRLSKDIFAGLTEKEQNELIKRYFPE